jgi:hypothetical protein
MNDDARNLLREIAALKRYDPASRKGSASTSPHRLNLTINIPKTLLDRIDAALRINLSPAETLPDGAQDWHTRCMVCGELPTLHPTGLCGPCCTGEEETKGGRW